MKQLYVVDFLEDDPCGIFNAAGDLIYVLDPNKGEVLSHGLLSALGYIVEHICWEDILHVNEYKHSDEDGKMPSHELVCDKMMSRYGKNLI